MSSAELVNPAGLGPASPEVTRERLGTGLGRRAWLAGALSGSAPGAWAAAALAPPAAEPVVPLAVASGVNTPFVDAVLRELAGTLALRWETVRVPFTRVLRMTEQGEALGFGISPTPEREARLVFSNAVFRSTVWALSRASAPRPAARIEELRGLEVCAARDARLGEELDAAAARDFRLRPANGDFATRLRMLAAGRCEVLLATHYSLDPGLLQRRIREAGMDPAEVALGPQPLTRLDVHVAARRDGPWAAWVPALNQALQDRQAAIARLLATGPGVR